MFGGHGSAQMLDIADALGDVQLVLMCGHNHNLAAKLRALRRPAPHAVVGFTPQVADHLRLGDLFIGKPGPGCLSEAVRMGLPVITFDNRWTLPQERFNAHWVVEQGIGLVLPSLRRLPAGVAALIRDLPYYRKRVLQIDNRAVFEVVDTLAELLQPASHPSHLSARYVARHGAAQARHGQLITSALRAVATCGAERPIVCCVGHSSTLCRTISSRPSCVLHQRRQALDPVAVVAVQHAVDVAHLGVVDVAADDALHAAPARLARDRDFEVADVADRALDLELEVLRQAPVRQAEPGAQRVERAVQPCSVNS